MADRPEGSVVVVDVVSHPPSNPRTAHNVVDIGDIRRCRFDPSKGIVQLLVARSDAFAETNDLVKVGLVEIAITPNPWAGGASYQQRLHVDSASVSAASPVFSASAWVDAAHDVVLVSLSASTPISAEVSIVRWRTAPAPVTSPNSDFDCNAYTLSADEFIAVGGANDSVGVVHRNGPSPYMRNVMAFQVLNPDNVSGLFDPLSDRVTGLAVTVPGAVRVNDYTVATAAPASSVVVAISTASEFGDDAFNATLSELVAVAPGMQTTAIPAGSNRVHRTVQSLSVRRYD